MHALAPVYVPPVTCCVAFSCVYMSTVTTHTECLLPCRRYEGSGVTVGT